VETLGLVGPFDNLDRPGSRSGKRFPEFVTGIASIGENMTHPGETTAHGFEDIDGAVTILDIGRVHEDEDQKPAGVRQDMPLPAFDILAGIIAARPLLIVALCLHMQKAPRLCTETLRLYAV